MKSIGDAADVVLYPQRAALSVHGGRISHLKGMVLPS